MKKSTSAESSSTNPTPTISDLQEKSKWNSRYDPKPNNNKSNLNNHKFVPLRHNTENLSAYDRHVRMMNTYTTAQRLEEEHQRRWIAKYRSDRDLIAESFKFLGPDDTFEPTTTTASSSNNNNSSEMRETKEGENRERKLAEKYYSKLFREYCLVNLTRYREGKFGLRWRTKDEVISGKGQFECGCLECKETGGLKTYEVNFKYSERGIDKNALVKLRLCDSCAEKMNYKRSEDKKFVPIVKKEKKEKEKKKKRREDRSDSEEEKKNKDKKKKTQKQDESIEIKQEEEEEEEEMEDEIDNLLF